MAKTKAVVITTRKPSARSTELSEWVRDELVTRECKLGAALARGDMSGAQIELGAKQVLESVSRMMVATRTPVILETETSQEDLRFQPWFLTREAANAIRSLQTMAEKLKWPKYYEKHGCVRCGKNKTPHGSNGFCAKCRMFVASKLQLIINEIEKERRER